jgi:Ca2+/Na+ antiporter
LRLHAPFMVVCTLAVLVPLVLAKKVGRGMGLLLAGFFGAYMVLNFWFRSR